MSQFLISLMGFLIAIGILVTVHEFGHFWVARCFGIKVLRFSIGFGRPFFRWHDKHGTEYVLSTIPLGGYVALFGERGGEIPESERSMAFSLKPVWIRIAVLAAGPLFNFAFAVLAYWLMFMIGISLLAPILGVIPNHSAAEMAGLRSGQEIVAVDHKPVSSWEAVSVALIAHSGKDKTISIDVREGEKGSIETHNLDLSILEGDHERNDDQGNDPLKELGLNPLDPYPPIVKSTMPGYPAEKAGILPLDKIVAIDDKPIRSRTEAGEYLQSKIDQKIIVTVLRNNEKISIPLQTVAKEISEGKTVGFMGVAYDTQQKPPKEAMRLVQFTPLKAFSEAALRTWNYSVLTLEMLGKMIAGKVSVKHLSGPITIAQYAGHTVQIGLEHFLSFLAVVSISLGVINLLPIPLLDGGHILYCICELITGKPVSTQVQNLGFLVGGVFILIIMMIALYNDVMRF